MARVPEWSKGLDCKSSKTERSHRGFKSHPVLQFFQRRYFELRYGIHSGIPTCCVVWFITGWQLVYGTRLLGWYLSKSPYHSYIPCPLCLSKSKRVPIRDCEQEGCHCQWKSRI